MPGDKRDILEVLKFELEFLEKGGYGRSPREAWTPQLIFEDSPTCMNFDQKENPAPCDECLLMQFVPQDRHHMKIPCRHIPLDADGETVQSLYQWGTQHEIEETLAAWLRERSSQLEALRRHKLETEQNDAAIRQ
ncbi:MAG TPA: hypothetical protein VOA41_05645 [Candidatus Dormibacteraeota bacterium]|nr:hypothetical protein [Candidatus Dormibacteraeota bacterium]